MAIPKDSESFCHLTRASHVDRLPLRQQAFFILESLKTFSFHMASLSVAHSRNEEKDSKTGRNRHARAHTHTIHWTWCCLDSRETKCAAILLVQNPEKAGTASTFRQSRLRMGRGLREALRVRKTATDMQQGQLLGNRQRQASLSPLRGLPSSSHRKEVGLLKE